MTLDNLIEKAAPAVAFVSGAGIAAMAMHSYGGMDAFYANNGKGFSVPFIAGILFYYAYQKLGNKEE